MTATLNQCSERGPALYVAFELGWSEWKLAFSTGLAANTRLRTIKARDTVAFLRELVKAKERFGLAANTPVYCCYEAGRDGFWLHRWLLSQGLNNLLVDSASIEVNRRQRRAKSDNLDAAKLVSMLIRYLSGDKKTWRVVNVPSAEEEDRRQLHRELMELKEARTEHVNRIRGLLAGWGLEVNKIDAAFPKKLASLRQVDDRPVPPQLHERLLREWERHQFVQRQIQDLENARARQIRISKEKPVEQVRTLMNLKGIGPSSAWLYVMECFSWRRIKNRKQLASLTGLTPTPYTSGDLRHEQGISKAGNRRMRAMAVEIAWSWLHWQPNSALTQWYKDRWGGGNSRQRRIGIVALARKLLVAIWRYLETGEVPKGAEMSSWKIKMAGKKRVEAACG
jgi:transposase